MFDDSSINTISLENISSADPDVIFVRPSEKLVIEVKATGRYQRIFWRRNAMQLVSSMPQDPQEFSNHYEIYVVGEATVGDIGLYEVSLIAHDVSNQQRIPTSISFIVVSPCKLLLIDIVLMTTLNTSTCS